MNIRSPFPRGIAGLASLAALALVVAPSSAGAASEGDVEVVNTETIQVYTDATGKVQTKRIYEQLSMTGDGSVELVNPIETDGLRNLDEFGGFEVEDGQQVYETSVDGSERLRTVSNYDGDLPLEVSVEYVLDGKTVDPEDVVGESGQLEVRYTVRNTTAEPQEISFPDGSGGTVTKTVDVPIPLVGSLTTTTPSNYTDVQSEGANMAGDGRGGTKLSFTMTLFPPIGTDTAEFGYTATITDGVVPQTDISVLPVNPLNVPTFKNAANSYQGGADTGARLAEGAGTIDENLLKLRDGAGELLAGLLKLHEGSGQLSAGLVNEAAPGAHKLADGAQQLDDGAKQLDDGANKLDDGLGQLDGGVGDLDAGANQLADGQRKLAAGLTKLYNGVDNLPASVKAELAKNPDYQRLLGALTSMAAGIGTLDQGPEVESLLGGLKKVKLGLTYPYSSLIEAVGPCQDDSDATPCGATNALDLITELKLNPAINVTNPAVDGTVAKLKATILSIKTHPSCTDEVVPPAPLSCDGTVDAVAEGIATAQTASLTELQTALRKVSSGIKTGLTNDGAGIDQLRHGLSTGVAPATCGTNPDGCGLREAALFIRDFGVPQLVAGITASIREELVAGIGVPRPGCDPTATLRCAAVALADGGGKLTAGIDQLVEGVTLLSDGGGQLADGTGQLVDGTGQLADGADQLAEGLGTAADGSEQLTDGLGQAKDGAPKLVDGAQRLSDEGTKQLVKAGEDTTQEYGELYATIAAGADRADAEGMAFGAPEGAMGLTAYSFVVQGEDGEGSRNLVRGLTGLALLGAGAGAFALRRRFI